MVADVAHTADVGTTLLQVVPQVTKATMDADGELGENEYPELTPKDGQLGENEYPELTPKEKQEEAEACSLGDEEDCTALEASFKEFRVIEDDVGDEAGDILKEKGELPQELRQELTNEGNLTEEAQFFGGFKVHIGPITIGTEGISVAPQMQFGMESNSFNFVAGCGDLRSGIKCEATAEVRKICETSGRGIREFCQNLKCHGEDLTRGRSGATIGAEVIRLLASEAGIDGNGGMHIKGKITYAQGASVMGGGAFGLWEDKDGFKMTGGGTAGLKKEVGGEIYVGIHKSGHKAKFKIAVGGGTAEGEFDCRYRKRDTKKANRIQGGVPVTTAPAEKFTPIGYGYGRGPQGQTTNGYCKMYVTWTDCLLQCDREHACIGFDAEQSFNTHWQQCCIRTSTYKTVHGWSSFRGNGDKVAKATGRGVSNRLVMAKNQFYRVGSGYARGKNGARTHAYCKMYVSFGACEHQCKKDPSCTGFDVERNWNRHWQQCCIRTLQNSSPYGWKWGPAKSIPAVQATTSSMNHNREVWVKAVR